MADPTSAFRAHLAKMMATKAAGADTSALAAMGAALIIGMRSDETEALLAAATPAAGASHAKRRVEVAEEEMLALQYQRSRAAHGISESRRAAGTLRLPEGLVSAEAAAVKSAAAGAPAARDAHQAMLQRLAVEHGERLRLGSSLEGVKVEKRRRVVTAAAQRSLATATRKELEGILFSADALNKELTPPAPAPTAEAASAQASALPEPLFCLWRAASALLSARGDDKAGAPTLAIEETAAAQLTRSDAAAATPAGAAAAAAAELFAAGPLSVVLRGRSGAALAFSYHSRPHVVGVTIMPSSGNTKKGSAPAKMEEGLCLLFAGDDARGLPDERCLLRAYGADGAGGAGEGLVGVEAMAPALPFRWAQWMGGIGPPLGGGREVHSMHSVLEALCTWLEQ